MPDLRFRPHHFLCAQGFGGKGYSKAFTANMTRIVMDGLRAPDGDNTEIEVIGIVDDICAPCPKRRGNLCQVQEKIEQIDARHAEALALRPGDKLTWGEAKARMKSSVRREDLRHLCKGCQWLELGLCEAALRDLLQDG
jgi:hypothetical protein